MAIEMSISSRSKYSILHIFFNAANKIYYCPAMKNGQKRNRNSWNIIGYKWELWTKPMAYFKYYTYVCIYNMASA